MSPATTVSSKALTKQDEVDIDIDIEKTLAEQHEQREIRRKYFARLYIEALLVLCLVSGFVLTFEERNNGSREPNQTLVKAAKVIIVLVNVNFILIVENIRLEIRRGRRPQRAVRRRKAAAPKQQFDDEAMSLRHKVKCDDEEVKGEEAILTEPEELECYEEMKEEKAIHTKPKKVKRDDNLLEEKIIYVKPQEIRCDDDELEEEAKVIYIKPKFSRGEKALLPVAEIRLDD
ncbi:hypothetical protein KEM56_000136 [Ascosphaera pollenicola]|nr:hypothetical protein KEM56_000136 [Ascosphaera pollenicola]